jgi:MinD superfamily P-loop ATPase
VLSFIKDSLRASKISEHSDKLLNITNGTYSNCSRCKRRARFNCRRQASANELKFNSVGGEGSSVGGAVGGPSFGHFGMMERADERGTIKSSL